MNIFTLSFSNLRYHGLSNIFNIVILALGIATIVTLLHVSTQIERRFERDLEGIDLVVGAKGSPLQLILSSVFHIDIPNGNIPLTQAEKLESNPLVKSAIPVALGDNYHSFRIVGTTEDYAKHYDGVLAAGRFWTKDMEAVLGSDVAKATQLTLGQKFVGSHGLTAGGEEHSEFPYEVVGVLAPTGTVIDQLVLTGVGSVWNIHEHHHHDANDHDADEEKHDGAREITSLLITYKSPLAAASLPRLVNKTSAMQAASPAFEIARLTKMMGLGSDTIELFAAVLMIIAAAGFFVTLFNAVLDRGYDIALMRSLGATRQKIFAFVLAEGLTLGFCGTALGIALGHIFAYAAQVWIETTHHITFATIAFHPYELYVIVSALGISAFVAIIPAFMAYRVNVAKILAQGL